MDKSKVAKSLANQRHNKVAMIAGFAALLAIYTILSVFLVRASQSDAVIVLMGQPTPVRVFVGAFSNIANFSLILLVVFYGKPGLLISLIIMIVQVLNLFMQIFVGHNTGNVSGLATNLFAIIAAILIYINNSNTKRYQEKLRVQAITDDLTGIANRFACMNLIRQYIRDRASFAVVTVNLNNFKGINNAMGSQTGNEVLREIARRMNDVAQSQGNGTDDFVSRQSGDEFAILIRFLKAREENDIRWAIRRYRSALEERITIDGVDLFISFSIGYAEYPQDATDADSLLSHANIAMLEAKRMGGGSQICRYTPDLMNVEKTLDMERKIREALENDMVFFHLQPQFDVEHNLVGFEALARIKDADGSYISPADFIPVAEKAGLVDQIDAAVFRKSAEFFSQLIRKTKTDITLSVNVSVKHLMKNDYLDEVRKILTATGVPANQIELEITESIMIDSVEKALECIREIKKMGIKIAIDDFGTGYSSLSYLNNFPADVLKIDKSFIDKMNSSDSSQKYVEAIISIGHVMNFKVISEGVEEDAQLDTLRSIGCDYIQGYIWGRPMPPEEAERKIPSTA